MPEPREILLGAAEEISRYVAPDRPKGTYMAAYGFVPAALINLLVPIIVDLAMNCLRGPEEMKALAAGRDRRSREQVFDIAHQQVSSFYTFIGRLFYMRRINLAASDLADAVMEAARQAPAERIGEVMQAARYVGGRMP